VVVATVIPRVDEDLDDGGVLHQDQRDVGADGAIGQLPDPLQVLAPVRGQRFDDSESTGVGHRRGQLCPRDERHRCLYDRYVDTQEP